jgi:uncharacterized membrane-anchored protein
METEVVKWWKNKWVVLLMLVGILTVVIGFLFAYFISWGWILTLVVAVVGGIGMMNISFKIIGIYNGKNKI